MITHSARSAIICCLYELTEKTPRKHNTRILWDNSDTKNLSVVSKTLLIHLTRHIKMKICFVCQLENQLYKLWRHNCYISCKQAEKNVNTSRKNVLLTQQNLIKRSNVDKYETFHQMLWKWHMLEKRRQFKSCQTLKNYLEGYFIWLWTEEWISIWYSDIPSHRCLYAWAMLMGSWIKQRKQSWCTSSKSGWKVVHQKK